MCRYASGLVLFAGLFCIQATAQAPDSAKKADQGYTPVRLWERPDVRATRVEVKAGATRAVHQHDDVKFHLFIPLTGKLQLTVGSEKPVDAPIGQAFWHFRHSLHSGLTRRLNRPSGEMKLSKAPSGQRYRHQKRGAKRLRAMMAAKIKKVMKVM